MLDIMDAHFLTVVIVSASIMVTPFFFTAFLCSPISNINTTPDRFQPRPLAAALTPYMP
jgi:hypothetical protein